MSYIKYYAYKKQQQVNGQWVDVYPLETKPDGNPIATYDSSAECNGRIKYKFTYSGGTVFSGECDNNTTLSSADTRYNPGQPGYDKMLRAEIFPCVTEIGVEAFKWCAITAVTIPNSVTSIDTYAFYQCRSLPSITIPNSVTYLGACSFERCSGLTSIAIPDSVTSAGSSVFIDCMGLTSMHIGSGLTTIPNGFVVDCRNLSRINSNVNGVCNIPNTVTTIAGDVFNRCAFTSLTIPDSVTSIGPQAFHQCSALTTVEIGTGIQSIGSDAFHQCVLTTVIMHSTTPPTIGERVFCNGWQLMTGVIYVPQGCGNAYKTAQNWSEYADIIQELS